MKTLVFITSTSEESFPIGANCAGLKKSKTKGATMYSYDPKQAHFQNLKSAAETLAGGHFTATSSHPNWRGKIACNYCNATGYGGSVETNSLWWGQKHGGNCDKRV